MIEKVFGGTSFVWEMEWRNGWAAKNIIISAEIFGCQICWHEVLKNIALTVFKVGF